VDGALLLNDLLFIFTRYLVLPPGAGVALALWVVFSHVHDAFTVSPVLGLSSPTKRAGKTTTLTILRGLVPQPLLTSNVTSAVLFRSIEKFVPTLLIDEADSFLKDSEELRGVLNSGHTRSAAAVIRSVGDQHEPRVFSTFCPKAIALIGKLPSTLEDRAILITLKRRAPGEKVEHLRLDRIDSELRALLQKASRWSRDHLEILRGCDPVVPEGLHDRAADNWRPLLSVAETCGGTWPDEARLAAIRLAAVSVESENTPAIQLLADLREIFVGRNADKIPSDEIVKELHKLEERPWADFRNGKPISTTQVARLLRPFEIHPKQLWVGNTNSRGYVVTDFEDAFQRYLS
jgi:putative DNA primase/helicase